MDSPRGQRRGDLVEEEAQPRPEVQAGLGEGRESDAKTTAARQRGHVASAVQGGGSLSRLQARVHIRRGVESEATRGRACGQSGATSSPQPGGEQEGSYRQSHPSASRARPQEGGISAGRLTLSTRLSPAQTPNPVDVCPPWEPHARHTGHTSSSCASSLGHLQYQYK